MTALLLLVFSGLFVVLCCLPRLDDHEIRSKLCPHYYGVCLIACSPNGVTLSQDLFTMYLFLKSYACWALVAAKGGRF